MTRSAHSRRVRAPCGCWDCGPPEKRGETGKAAEDYARALIEADIGKPEATFNKLVNDLAGHGVDARQIREKRDALFAIVHNNSA